MKRIKREEPQAEMSMSAMIDMVFLLLIFFLATARPDRPEAELSVGLPGVVDQAAPMEFSDVQCITVKEDGALLLNDSPVSESDLARAMNRYRECCEANKTAPMIVVDPSNQAPHQLFVRVLDLCARAKLKGVSIAGGDDA